MQIKQNISVFVPKDQVDIALVKKCKATDVPALNTAVGNIQKALQRYVGYDDTNPVYCNRIKDLMDRAQAWCLDIKELYNKAEVHSINTSKGDAEDVGVFCDNAKVTIFEFLEAAELAYLGWGNNPT